jgi:hypothetical protein
MGLTSRAVKPRKGYLAQDSAKLKRVKEIFAERLAAALEGKGARELAPILAVGEREAQRYLRGKRIPSATILGRLEVGLLVSVAHLVGLDSPRIVLSVAQDEPSASGVGSTAPGDPTAQQVHFVGLVHDALMGAVERALKRDELEHTRKGRFVLGNAFMDLALQLEDHGVEVRELRKVARELQKLGQP